MKNRLVDIEFQNLSYIVKGKEPKKILHSINGTFRSGNLIGILGSSGAGKTSLLSALAGHIHKGIYGTVKINGKLRESREFNKMCCYIMQEDVLQKYLTVREAMMIACDLKLGKRLSKTEKLTVIEDIANLIGLENCVDARTDYLSGGQRKRLIIALELINNPPVLFLDEPTTGLDNVVAKQCMELLKSLAEQGRTVICTIHQPSDSVFELFDQVYFLSNGYCVYNGRVDRLVPFLDAVNLQCPVTYSPADYGDMSIELTSDQQ